MGFRVMTERLVPIAFAPKTPEELEWAMSSPLWRVCSGKLYVIMPKSDLGDGTTIPFIPNRAQRRFLARMWTRNIILKARQLGYTTLIAIIWLDHALFNPDQRCGIIAQDREKAEVIFRDKVKFAYDRLPDEIRAQCPLARDSANELLFAHNNSSIRVGTSMRSGTIHRLHVSEFGKIGAEHPDKAREVITGSLPAVPLDGIIVIESTSEGQSGEFFNMTKRARALADDKDRVLTARDYRFTFSAWHDNPEYEVSPQGVIITAKDHEYFDGVEAKQGTKLTIGQRAWYCSTCATDFSGNVEMMWQEYPSTPDEAFQQSTEGTYYAVQLAAARRSGRIGRVPLVSHVPVNTYWDIGARDGAAIWLHQKIGAEHRFVGFDEGWDETFGYFVSRLQARGLVWGTHFLPHDAEHKRQQGTVNESPKEMLEKLAPGWKFEIVPRIDNKITGIQQTRDMFSQAYFDETECAAGLAHLASYRKEWDKRLGCWKVEPKHNTDSEAADAFRQWGQSAKVSFVPLQRIKRTNLSGMAA